MVDVPNWSRIERDLAILSTQNNQNNDDDLGSSMAPHDRDSMSRDSFNEAAARAAGSADGFHEDDYPMVPEGGSGNRLTSLDYGETHHSDADTDNGSTTGSNSNSNSNSHDDGSPVTDDTTSDDDLVDVHPLFRGSDNNRDGMMGDRSFLQSHFIGETNWKKSRMGGPPGLVMGSGMNPAWAQNRNDYQASMEGLLQRAQERAQKILLNAATGPAITQIDLSGIRHLQSFPEMLKGFQNVTELKADNCDLTSLHNLPPNLERLYIRNNNIKIIGSLDLPANLTFLDATNNQVDCVLLDESGILELNLSNNPLKSELRFPKMVHTLRLAKTSLDSTDIFEGLDLISLDISRTHITCVDNLPQTLKVLRMTRTKVKFIVSLPLGLEEWHANTAGIEQIAMTEFPRSLQTINLYDNELNTIPKLPDVVSRVDLMRNILNEYPTFPQTIEDTFDIRDNPVTCDNLDMAKQIELQLKYQHPKANIQVVDYRESTPDSQESNSTSTTQTPGMIEYQRHLQRQKYNATLNNTAFNSGFGNSYNASDFDAFTGTSNSSAVKISTQNEEAREANLQNVMRSQNLFTSNRTSHRGSGRGGTSMRGNFRGRGGHRQINNYFANPTHDRELVRKMTDDGHRPSRRYQIVHKSIYTVN